MKLYSMIHKSDGMPKWLKVLFYIVLTITLIYWLGFLFYKILDILRVFLHWASDERNWWTFVCCVLILVIGSLVIAQVWLGLDPFGKMWNGIVNTFNNIRDWFANKIHS